MKPHFFYDPLGNPSSAIQVVQSMSQTAISSYRPELPDYGVFAQWPEPGYRWIHPQDITTLTALIPSRRVFRRERFDGTYYHLSYGQRRFRVRPTFWIVVPDIDVSIGQTVELLSQFGRYEPGIATIQDVFAELSRGVIEFSIKRGNMVLPNRVSREQFRLLSTRVHLRLGTQNHPQPRFDRPIDLELLNVGDLS